MGPGVHGSPGVGGLVHEYPIERRGGVEGWEEYGEFGTGFDSVSKNAQTRSRNKCEAENDSRRHRLEGWISRERVWANG